MSSEPMFVTENLESILAALLESNITVEIYTCNDKIRARLYDIEHNTVHTGDHPNVLAALDIACAALLPSTWDRVCDNYLPPTLEK